MKETVLLIDGDVIAYRAAAVCEKRTVVVKHNKSGAEKVFNTRREFKAYLKERNWEHRIDEYSFTDVQTPDDISNCLHSIKTTIGKLESITFADRKEIYIGGKENFRSKLLLPKEYKGSRKDAIRPLMLNQAKEYLLEYQGAAKATKIEADDILNIRAYEELNKGNVAIIGSNDKDTLQSEGIFMYDWTVEEPKIVEIPVIGDLRKVNQYCKGEGLKFFAYQLLAGDTADEYVPYQLAKSVFGSKYSANKAYEDIKNLDFADEILNKVIEVYKRLYPEPFDYVAWDGTKVKNADWKSMLDLYFKCAYMKRSWTDPSDWRIFFAERGVYDE